MKDTTNIVLCGLGGQGILFMTRVLAQAALDKGFEILGAETHGMAQRGGSVVSHLKIGEAQSSLVRTGSAHLVLALEEDEAYRNLPFLALGSELYVNANGKTFPREEVRDFLEKWRITHRAIAAGNMAMALGAPMSTNLALLGFFSAFREEPVNHKELRDTIERITPDRFKAMNLKVFDAGYEKACQPLS